MRTLLVDIERQLSSSPHLDGESRADARRETRVLVAAVLGTSVGDIARQLSQAPDAAITASEEARIRAAASRRSRGEPLAYAVGVAAFRHLELRVDHRVLIPRPETEIVVDQVLAFAAGAAGGIVVDIGTGSGAIALALATEGHFDRIIATDISDDALAVASANAAVIQAKTPVEFRLGADLAPLAGILARVIVSNPPYIAYDEADALPDGVRNWEPATALFAPDGGMARYKVLFAHAAPLLETEGALVVEVDARRAQETAALARQFGWTDVHVVQDLSGRDRVLVARNPDRRTFVSPISAGRTETTIHA